MQSIVFTVHGAYNSTVSKLVKVGNDEMSASVAAFIVELVDDQGQSYTRRFIGSDIATAKEYFKSGSTVTWSL